MAAPSYTTGVGGTTAGTGADLELSITHIATGKWVSFKKIKLRTFKDQLTTKYNQEEVFGRMDPIMTYQGTQRKITMGFDIGTSSDKAAMSRVLAMISRLMQFQYPVYENAGNALSLQRPPLVEVKFANYIRSGDGGPLVCAMHGVSFSPFDKFDKASNPMTAKANLTGEKHIIPKRVSVDLELTPLHNLPMGWMEDPTHPVGAMYPNETGWWGGDKWGKIDFDAYYDKKKKPAGDDEAGRTLTALEIAQLQVDHDLDLLPDAEVERLIKIYTPPPSK